ncbi:MAG: PQQ-dependent sugar dehydrogenase [Chloroflexota bacterium]|nr:PQQ-dependent sugar dehydrogenase [Chloroflexota bacterium]
MKFTRIVTQLIALLSFGAGGCGMRDSVLLRVGLELIAEGFTSPVALATPQDGSGRLFVADQTGVIWIISESERIEKPFIDLREHIVELNSFYDERGLLGLAFHPDFAINGRFYISYSAPLREGLSPEEWDHTTYISQFSVSTHDPNLADPDSEQILLAMDKPGYNYEAGHIAFGPDGYLYIATGDSVRDPASEAGKFAQDTISLLGKILRIDVNKTGKNGEVYAIPPDNPFTKGGGHPEVFAYGFRNPYRFSFDTPVGRQDKSFDSSSSTEDSRLFVVDVGQAMMEEVNLVVAGGNYGWPTREGITCFDVQSWNQPFENCPTEKLIDPIIAYAHAGDLSAIIGGMVYYGERMPALDGGYVFGDWGRGNGHLFIAHPPIFGTGLWKMMEIQGEGADQSGIGQLLGIGQDENGELYLLTKAPGVGTTGNSGSVYKIVPTGE